MDSISLVRECMLSKGRVLPGNPFISRPWLEDKAAAATPSGNVGVKGIIAGNYLITKGKKNILKEIFLMIQRKCKFKKGKITLTVTS